MTIAMKRQYMKAIYTRYHRSDKIQKGKILDEFCKVWSCHRKHALRTLNKPLQENRPLVRNNSRFTYGNNVIKIIEEVWQSSRYPWSVLLKKTIKTWLPHIRRKFATNTEIEKQLLSISSAQIDRRLKKRKLTLRKSIYGTTKPGAILKQNIPIKTKSWDIKKPGYLEIDLVAHCGASGAGNFANTLDMIDIASTWIERRAFLGKSQIAVCEAIDDVNKKLPFKMLGIDSDNGSEFINAHTYGYCSERNIKFTRSRAYKKNDNAHIEQKNFTHVRKPVGYARYDTLEVVNAINDLYQNELLWFDNLFQPSVKLKEKVRIGSKIKRKYYEAETPLDRLISLGGYDKDKVNYFVKLRKELNPFNLSENIQQKLNKIYEMANNSVKTVFCPKNVYKPQIIVRRAKHQIDTANSIKVFSDTIPKLKKMYKKEVLLQTR